MGMAREDFMQSSGLRAIVLPGKKAAEGRDLLARDMEFGLS
jgi:hypothetical protein